VGRQTKRRALSVALVIGVGVLAVLGPPASAQSTSPSDSSSTSSSSDSTSSSSSSDSTSSTGDSTPTSTEAVQGTLLDKKGTADSKDDEPVKGVKVNAEDASGKQVGTATADEDGKFTISLPGPGHYLVRLALDTLPKGVTLDESAATREFDISPDQVRTLVFDIGGAARHTTGKFEQFQQAAADGAYFGLIIALCAVGLSLIYGTTGLVNFAHGELITFGAIVAYYFNRNLGWPLLLAAPVAVVFGGAFGWLQYTGLWGPLRRRGTGNIAQMVISIGLALSLVNVYQYFFGALTRPYSDFHAQRAVAIGTIELAPKKLVSMAICLLLLVAVAVALQRTRTGKAMRAISDNPDLASSTGIDVDHVVRVVWVLGAALAALGGILFSIAQDVNFEQGSGLLLLLFAAITLGGLGEAYGALVGGFVVGLFVNVSTVWIPTELKNVGALAVLIIVLLIRPQGILGRAERIG
jgi:branched-chain amino acid transport system permease protein